MKKILLLLLLSISINCIAQNQNQQNFNAKYNSILTYLSEENWTKSENQTKKLLSEIELLEDFQTERKILRYIYIYSVGGLLNENKLSKKEALQKVYFLKSTEMIMPAHPFIEDCNINCTHISDDDKNTFFTCVNNAAGTQIFCFDYVKIKNGIKDSKEALEGKYIRLEGKLKEISVEGYMLPRFKLIFIDGSYKIM
ncbi:hypothetical protein ACQKCH_08370 [Nubsella zeaxanthinifaciens]|uniref:hypothetical protein n=1 Tax=Nubsella zeaxanthinifaciens TaxID=392412 RepID=UPI003D0350B6